MKEQGAERGMGVRICMSRSGTRTRHTHLHLVFELMFACLRRLDPLQELELKQFAE